MTIVLPLVGALIQQLAPYVKKEYSTFKDVNKHAEKLSSNLTAIHAVLQDAEEKQITSRALKDWLQKLTDAAHILEDILDRCSILSEANKDKHSIFLLYACHRHSIGKKLKNVTERIDAIAEERVKFGLNAGTTEHRLVDDERRQTTSGVTEFQIHGRDEDRAKVVDFLLKEACDREELSVYSIVGHGGYGKTALAQLVFNDKRVDTHFDLKIWVCVSDDFNLMKLFRSILEIIEGKNLDLHSLESMQKKVQEVLQNKRYLLVLDDVWSEDPEKWSTFKYPLQNGTKGSSILVTTRLETVANIEGLGTHPAHHLEGLLDDDIWSLFRQQAWSLFGPNGEERAELVKIGKDIVRKCDGSPLAAKALGSLLRFKTKEHQWDSIEKSEIWNLYDDATKSALTLSYYNLKLSLRPCFTFCAVFSKDFKMVKADLIHLWMANGFISSRGILEVEHVGNEVWDELYQRSFFQEVKTDDEGIVTFKMHDIFHDIARDIMGEQCLALETASLTTLSKRVHHIGCFNVDEQSKYNLIPFKSVESLRTVLQFYPPKSNLSVFPSTTPLRVLSTNFSQLSALKSFIHLRYLEIYGSGIVTLPESICSLRKLQTLKLVDCYRLTGLPKQLTQLQDLRHLLIKQCRKLRSMPCNIGGLTHLKTLNLFIVGAKTKFGLAGLHNLQLGGKLHIKGLENVSNETNAKEANLIGKKELSHLYLSWGTDANSQVSVTSAEQVLEALEPHTSLKYFAMMGYKGINIPNWMRNTSTLEGLVEVILSECRNCERLPPLGKLPCLTSLYVSGMRHVKYIDDDLYEGATKKAFPTLKKMRLDDLPNLERVLKAEGVEMLSQLSKLRINGIPKLAFPSLPSVETLYIYDCPELSSLPDWLGTMTSLQTLKISWCPKLNSLPDWMGTMTSLQTLLIRQCPKLSSLPASFKELINLKELTIYECPKLEKRCKKETGEEWHKIAHVPKLDISTFEPSFNEKMKEFWRFHHDDKETFYNLDHKIHSEGI
ncbi:putative disease resistance protein RGA3 [Trifolium repens]|nr:putative disease resistance protein RGA3 [Trifolium repens]